MANYSHSRISAYENCPYQYKLKYIDRIKVDTPTTIEIFIGDLVHRTLEKLYKDKKFKKRVSKDVLLKFYRELWEKEYSKDILVVKENQGFTAENYRRMGLKFISDYYERMKPFEEMTILGLETQDRMTLPDGNQWHVRIDKLGCDSNGNYFVCDYKTNARMKDQEEADSDRQLAMYSIWVKDKFKDCKSVKLIWHMLAFNKDAVSERTDAQLEKLQQEICDKIKEIEFATEFPRNQTGLCDYCIYKEICPSFKHEAELDKVKTIEEFKEDEGVKLVDEYSEIKTKLIELKKSEEKFKEDLIKFSKQFDVDVVYGSNQKCSIKEFDRIVLPKDKKLREKFLQLLKDKGIYEECSMLCYPKINKRIIKGEIEEDINKMVDIEKDFRLTLTKKKDIDED